MDKERLIQYDWLSKNHWWITSKYKLLRDLITHNIPKNVNLTRMLDIGCATGIFLGHIKDIVKDQFGMDLNQEILYYMQDGHVPVVASNAKTLPFKNGTFSLISAIDILEHVDDDVKVLEECNRVLGLDGWLLISVPAFRVLFGKHDECFGHYRRYSRREMVQKLRSTGFRVERATYVQPLFFLPLLLKRRFFPPKDSLFGDFGRPNPVVNKILHNLLSWERYFVRYFSFPVGSTLFVLASKGPDS